MDKQISQTRVDNYVSSGSYARVLGRSNHEISTDIQITKKFDGQCYAFFRPDNEYDRFEGEAASYRRAHVPYEYRTDAVGGGRGQHAVTVG